MVAQDRKGQLGAEGAAIDDDEADGRGVGEGDMRASSRPLGQPTVTPATRKIDPKIALEGVKEHMGPSVERTDFDGQRGAGSNIAGSDTAGHSPRIFGVKEGRVKEGRVKKGNVTHPLEDSRSNPLQKHFG